MQISLAPIVEVTIDKYLDFDPMTFTASQPSIADFYNDQAAGMRIDKGLRRAAVQVANAAKLPPEADGTESEAAEDGALDAFDSVAALHNVQAERIKADLVERITAWSGVGDGADCTTENRKALFDAHWSLAREVHDRLYTAAGPRAIEPDRPLGSGDGSDSSSPTKESPAASSSTATATPTDASG